MQRQFYFCFCLLLSYLIDYIDADYGIPEPELELIGDRIFRLTIDDDNPDTVSMEFNVNVNKPFKKMENPQLKCVSGKATNSLWSCDFSRSLQDHDVIFPWISVDYGDYIYNVKKLPITVGAVRYNARRRYSTRPNKCRPTITEVENSRNICEGQLIFLDDFDELMTEYWTNEVRTSIESADAEFVIYNGSVSVNYGVLKITAYPSGLGITDELDLGNRCTASNKDECMYKFRLHHFLPPIVSGRLNTAKYFNFKYGRIEVRARTPIGDWLYPLITLQTSRDKYGSNAYANGEMRIAFVRGNPVLMSDGVDIGGTRLFGGPIFSINANERHKYMSNVTLPDKEQFGEKFHTYSLTWKPDELLLSVDNYQYGRIPINSDDSARVPSQRKPGIVPPLDQMFYITLGLAVGGHGDFTDNIENKPWENTNTKAIVTFYEGRDQFLRTWKQPSLEVDYVRVFAI